MPWKDAVPPLAPRQVVQTNASSPAQTRLSWQPPLPAPDGETARWYAVYRFPGRSTPVAAADLASSANLVAVTDTVAYTLAGPADPGRYAYVVTALDRLHNESAPANVATVLATAAPLAQALFEPAVPNPFASETRLAFTLPAAGPANLRVFDLTGRQVAVLATGIQPAGRHEAVLRAAELPAGLYVVVLQTAGGVARQKVQPAPTAKPQTSRPRLSGPAPRHRAAECRPVGGGRPFRARGRRESIPFCPPRLARFGRW